MAVDQDYNFILCSFGAISLVEYNQLYNNAVKLLKGNKNKSILLNYNTRIVVGCGGTNPRVPNFEIKLRLVTSFTLRLSLGSLKQIMVPFG
jgi:hypothetical protein